MGNFIKFNCNFIRFNFRSTHHHISTYIQRSVTRSDRGGIPVGLGNIPSCRPE